MSVYLERANEPLVILYVGPGKKRRIRFFYLFLEPAYPFLPVLRIKRFPHMNGNFLKCINPV